jgi:hypothetical protein
MPKPPKIDTSFNFGANRKPRRRAKRGKGRKPKGGGS